MGLRTTKSTSGKGGNSSIGGLVTLSVVGLGVGAVLAFNGWGGLVPKSTSTYTTDSSSDIYVSAQTKTYESAKGASSILSGFRGGSPEQFIDVDVMRGDSLANVYSGSLDRMALNDVSNKIRHKPEESSGRALVASLQRAGKLISDKPDRPLHLYIITEGSSDPSILSEMREVAEDIRDSGKNRGNVQLYFMGLDPDKRIETIATLNPVRTMYGGSCAQSAAECRELIDKAVR